MVTITLGVILGFRHRRRGCALFAFAVSWVWTLIALVVRSQQSAMAVSMAILFPPDVRQQHLRQLQAIDEVNPITLVGIGAMALAFGAAGAAGRGHRW